MKYGKRQLILASLVLALGAAVYLNWQFAGTKVQSAGDVSEESASSALGAAQLVNNAYVETVSDTPMNEDGVLPEMPLKTCVAAVSAGIVGDELLLDLCYEEDSGAQVDLNCVMTGEGALVELQGTSEGRSFTIAEQQALVALCQKGIREIQRIQKQVLGGGRDENGISQQERP